jgi:putative spermidine/putrescine transport system substrate-binding protein
VNGSTKRSRTLLAVLAVAGLVSACGGDDGGGSADAGDSEKPKELTVVSYGGDYQQAQDEAYWKPFLDANPGVTIRQDSPSDNAKIKAMAESGNVTWDLALVDDSFGLEGHGEWLEPIDYSVVDKEQFLPGYAQTHRVGADVEATVFAYRSDKLDSAPHGFADFFDTKKFPGKRAVWKYAAGGVLEAALLADGVAAEDLYPIDVDRALKKLDTIKDDIVWWSSGDDAVRLLTTGECDLGVAWTGRAYNAVTKDNAPLAITWQDGMYLDAAYAIPKGSPNAKNAQAMLAMWILDEQGQQDFLKGVPYPTPIKGLEYPAELAPWLPAGENLDKAVASDDAYFAENINDLTSRFTKWVGE